MAKKIIEFFEQEEQLVNIIKLNYVITGFGFFLGALLTGKTLLFAVVAVCTGLISATVHLLYGRLNQDQFKRAASALWLVDIVFFETAFVATTQSPLFLYILLLAVAALYGHERVALGILAVGVGHELWLQTRLPAHPLVLHAFTLIIFYLFFWFAAKYFMQKNQELKQMREELLKAEHSTAVQKMTMTLSHELNNPLTAVVINVDLLGRLLRKSADPQKLEPLIKTLVEDTHRMKRIMDDLRNMSGENLVEEQYVNGKSIFSIKKSLAADPNAKREYNPKPQA